MAPRNVAVVAPDPMAGHFDSASIGPIDLSGKCGSVFCGSLLLLGPGVHKILLCPARVCFLSSMSSIIKSCWLSKSNSLKDTQFLFWIPRFKICCEFYNFCNSERTHKTVFTQFVGLLLSGCIVELLATTLRGLRPHALPPGSAAASAPVPVAGYCWPLPLRRPPNHAKTDRSGSVSCGGHCSFSVSWCTQVLFCALQTFHIWFQVIHASCHLFGLLLCPWREEISFFGGIQHPSVDGCSTAGWDFGVLAGEDECTFFRFLRHLEPRWYFIMGRFHCQTAPRCSSPCMPPSHP